MVGKRLAAVVTGLLLVVAIGAGMAMAPAGRVAGASSIVYVAPKGQDKTSYGTKSKPYRTISYALSKAVPGTMIIVKAGTYAERIVTAVDGTADQPIELQTDGRVVLTGGVGSGRVMEVRHDYYVITGFEFAGNKAKKDVLLWLQEADNNTVVNNFFHHAQGECVRLKYQSTGNILASNRFEYCGQFDFGGGGTGKNGEGIYLGTAPEQLDRNPTPEVDQTNNNIIRHNTFATHGNECVDIKEGSGNNVVEFNDCTGQLDPNSGGFDSRGNYNTFRYNKSYGNAGAGIRLGGDTATDGINNEVYGNELIDNENVALKVMRLPQGLICGNTANGNVGGFSNESTITNSPC